MSISTLEQSDVEVSGASTMEVLAASYLYLLYFRNAM